jgi:hypothetical protein
MYQRRRSRRLMFSQIRSFAVGSKSSRELHFYYYLRLPVVFNMMCREWPTIPQLYVGGEFIGGCDIIMGSAYQYNFLPFIVVTISANMCGGSRSAKIWRIRNPVRVEQRHPEIRACNRVCACGISSRSTPVDLFYSISRSPNGLTETDSYPP